MTYPPRYRHRIGYADGGPYQVSHRGRLIGRCLRQERGCAEPSVPS